VFAEIRAAKAKERSEKKRRQREELEMMGNDLGLGFSRSGGRFVLTGLMLGAAALALIIAPRGSAPAFAVESSAYEEMFKKERVGSQPPLEFGEFVATPDELASVPVNDIVKSIRLNAIAMMVGKEVYGKHCAGCHGADLKGSKEMHAPDLTDAAWIFSGDDLQSGGLNKHPSDVEWTVRYGIRSGKEYARGVEADMLAYDPQYRSQHDIEDYGTKRYLNDAEIANVAEYVLKLGRQKYDRAKAARGDAIFHDNARGNCFDCHTDEGTGNDSIGSTNLTRPDLYLYGSDRATIIETITKGRVNTMPAFEDQLTPIELKAVSVYVFSNAGTKEAIRRVTSGRRVGGAKGAAHAAAGTVGTARRAAR
jgi:cytochrome c oxidase cbb3-type subunit 3